MKSSAGITLLMTMSLTSLFFSLLALDLLLSRQTDMRIMQHQHQKAAQVQAESGVLYARHMLAEKKWLTRRKFRSPAMAPGQSFQVEVVPSINGDWTIVSTGIAGSVRHLEKAAFP